MVALNNMKARTKVLTVEWDGEAVDVSYFPNAVTPALLESVMDAAEKEDMSILGTMLEPILDWWDITENDGGPRVPTDAETIRNIPMSFLTKLQKTIQEAQNPPESSSSDDS